MSRPSRREAAQTSHRFQFTLTGLIVFSLALIGGASLLVYNLTLSPPPKLADESSVSNEDKNSVVQIGPWGELLTEDIQLERPAEYLTDEVANPQPEVWTFFTLNSVAVKDLLVKHGLSAEQVADMFAPGRFVETSFGTEVQPSKDFFLSMNAETRQKLYLWMAGLGVNLYLDYPYIFPANDIDTIFADKGLNADDVALFKRLVYTNGQTTQFSDYQFLLCQIPTSARRVALARALSRQSAVMARLAVRPTTDIDKIASYWSSVPNVRITNIRPLLESLKQLPDGGSISLLHLLPKFARDRLYTYPLPPQADEPMMDCHWSTFNFSSETPDNQFNDPNYTVPFIQKNYYQIAAPSQYGDVVLLMNDKQEVKHSAVYLAADLVFTKNGNNYRQPWMFMRIPDLLATYPTMPPMKVITMRRKTN